MIDLICVTWEWNLSPRGVFEITGAKKWDCVLLRRRTRCDTCLCYSKVWSHVSPMLIDMGDINAICSSFLWSNATPNHSCRSVCYPVILHVIPYSFRDRGAVSIRFYQAHTHTLINTTTIMMTYIHLLAIHQCLLYFFVAKSSCKINKYINSRETSITA